MAKNPKPVRREAKRIVRRINRDFDRSLEGARRITESLQRLTESLQRLGFRRKPGSSTAVAESEPEKGEADVEHDVLQPAGGEPAAVG